jgi:hypothetical protein
MALPIGRDLSCVVSFWKPHRAHVHRSGKFSVVDPRICVGFLVGWFRIQEGKNDPQLLKKNKEISFFEALDVSPAAWTSFMETWG